MIMNRTSIWWASRLALSGLLLVLTWLMVRPVEGHGLGKQKLKQVEAGPYMVSAWIDPEEPAIDEALHVTVSVQENATSITDADVSLTATHQGGDADPVSAQATHDDAVNELFYEGSLNLPESGDWDINIDIDGEAGQAESSFTVEVLADTSEALMQVIAGLGVGIAILAALFFTLRQRQHAPTTNEGKNS